MTASRLFYLSLLFFWSCHVASFFRFMRHDLANLTTPELMGLTFSVAFMYIYKLL